MSRRRPDMKIRCGCPREANLAFVYQDRDMFAPDRIAAIEPRPGVEWTEVPRPPSPFVRPGAVHALGWVARCPKCHEQRHIDAREVRAHLRDGSSTYVVAS